MPSGGRRENTGPKKGTIFAHTLEKRRVEAEIKNRIMGIAHKLFVSQASLALGSISIFRRVIIGKGDKQKIELVLVENKNEIKRVLEETEGTGGVVDDDYYIVTTNKPDNKAIDSMYDRAFGKARQNIGVDGGEDGAPIKFIEDKIRSWK